LEKESERGKGKDEVIKERLETAKTSLRGIDDELAPLKAEYAALKGRTDEINTVRERIDELKMKAERAERDYDLASAADIRYGAIPSLQDRLAQLEQNKRTEDASRGRSVLGEEEVTPDSISEIVARVTGIPASSLKQSEKERLLKMEKVIGKEVIGQPEAIKAIANAVRLSRSGLSNPNKPTGSFLFCGPSGTGKTQTVKVSPPFTKTVFKKTDC
jgi:ATP-dependent Clp protease ATP-binding subunit ClpA